MVNVDYIPHSSGVTYTDNSTAGTQWIESVAYSASVDAKPAIDSVEANKREHRQDMRRIVASQRRVKVNARPRQAVREKPRIIQQPIGRA